MTLVYVSALIALLLTLIAGVPYLDFLKKNLYGQFIREEAPVSHAKKAGTPTAGGIIIVLPAMVAATLGLLMAQRTSFDTFIILLTFALFTFIGFQDDIAKIIHKQNKGLSAKGKILLQILIAIIPAVYVTFLGERSVSVFGLYNIDLGLLYPFFAIFVIIGASNAVNLTDGLDGLAAGTMFIALAAITYLCIVTGRIDIAIVSVAITGSCLGFLYYNKLPAKIFMGDTGSLALGGVLGTLAVIGKCELWLVIIGGIFVIEALSVILQVISFKTTGKRIFKMSPIHHHFELSGWSESKIVYTFWFVGLVFAVIAIMFKLYLS
ncbi:MAG: phospho-N-acetylmuramoyl-pentapeptide-transferase [uncultured bacterium]|nr:MAG: phospho-N-acetylmuramoyl-pentapeptide-transferase [uncultured bacterium]HBH17532.1 phospho-N-acetylmuramoyl-pentapeptide-transferase [Cyanobacteria bacterium UBA9579]